MANLFLKKIQSERNALWAAARLRGLPKDTPERIRIAELDAQIAEQKAKIKAKDKPKPAAKPKRKKPVKKAPDKAD